MALAVRDAEMQFQTTSGWLSRVSQPVGFDVETDPFHPGCLAPDIVCLGSYSKEIGPSFYHADPAMMANGPLSSDPVGTTLEEHLEWILAQDPIYGINVAYDLACCASKYPKLFPKIWQAYDEGRVIDILLSQRLIDNADGMMPIFENKPGYNATGLALRHLKKDRSADKDNPDAWRTRFGDLRHVPIEEIPQDAIEYQLDDAIDPYVIGEMQWAENQELIANSPAQARAAFALQLIMCWGVHTDPDRIEQLRVHSEKLYIELSEKLSTNQLPESYWQNIASKVPQDYWDYLGPIAKQPMVRGAEAKKAQRGKQDIKATCARIALVMMAQGRKIKLNDSGEEEYERLFGKKKNMQLELAVEPQKMLGYISRDADACKETHDDVLYDMSLRTQLGKVVKTDIPDLLKGVNEPIQPRYNTFMETGRTSCSKGKPKKKSDLPKLNGYQFQNPKRAFEHFPNGSVDPVPLFPPGVGVRECFISRPGTYFIDNDFTGLELHTQAQACLDTVGYSELANALNAKIDPHLKFAATMMKISYEEAFTRKNEKTVKFFRQLAKVWNFGAPGGLGVDGMVGFARSYGVKLDPSDVKVYQKEWYATFPEWVDYFKFIRSHLDRMTGVGQIEQLRAQRIRGGITYTSGSNTLFQGLGADAAKAALYEVSKRCYTAGTVLFGVRPVGFIHDEILAEAPVETSSIQAIEMAKVMVDAANVFLPDVPVRCEPALSKRWSKNAAAIYDENKVLQPYDLAKERNARVFYPDGSLVDWKKAA